MKLAEAQELRHARVEEALDARIERVLDRVGLSEGALLSESGTRLASADVTVADRVKLKGILKYYAKKPHPFTDCVRDNTKRFGPERAKKICATLKDVIRGTKWRKGGGHKMAEGIICPLVDVDEGVIALLEAVNQVALAQVVAEAEIVPPDLESGGAQTPREAVA